MEEDKKDKTLNKQTTDEKLNKMRLCVQDEQKCKIIAKELTKYILNKD